MSEAYKCDECSEFMSGEPAISVTMNFGSSGGGLFGAIFGGSSGEVQDFCSLGCLESFSFDNLRDRMILEYDKKDELLGANDQIVEGDDGYELHPSLVEAEGSDQ